MEQTQQKKSRFDYVQYDDHSQLIQSQCKRTMQEMESFLQNLADGRAKSLAITKLEEAYMWIGKSIRDDQITRLGVSNLQEERTNS